MLHHKQADVGSTNNLKIISVNATQFLRHYERAITNTIKTTALIRMPLFYAGLMTVVRSTAIAIICEMSP